MLRSIDVSVKLAVMVMVDNIRAIFMATNITTTSCTKHVHIRHEYMNEYVKDGVVKIIFVKFSENDYNVLTKKSAELHEKHSRKIICEMLE